MGDSLLLEGVESLVDHITIAAEKTGRLGVYGVFPEIVGHPTVIVTVGLPGGAGDDSTLLVALVLVPFHPVSNAVE